MTAEWELSTRVFQETDVVLNAASHFAKSISILCRFSTASCVEVEVVVVWSCFRVERMRGGVNGEHS